MREADLHDYQRRAIAFASARPQSALWIDMGLGKTVVALSVLADRIDRVRSSGTLVVGPMRVIQTVWHEEAKKWEHLRHLKFNIIHGTPDVRTRAAMTFAHVYCINYENLGWLANLWTKFYLTRGKYLPVNSLVLDEVTKVKNAQSQRHKALQRMLSFLPYRMGLTGTPASNGYMDLFGQYLALDSGARLGQTESEFKKRFVTSTPSPDGNTRERLVPGAENQIKALIGDITIQMDNKDYLDLPPVIDNIIKLQLPAKRRAQYRKLEEEMWVELDSGTVVDSFNAAALTGRCLQFAQGALYTAPGSPEWEQIHDVKLDALDSVVGEAAGKPVLVAVAFRHDAERILARYPGMVWVDSRMGVNKFNETLDRWVRGDLPGIIANPRSLGHGVDRLKEGPVDDMVWFGDTWSLDDHEQFLARIIRQGRTRPLRVHHLVMTGTLQVAQRLALKYKARSQNGLKAALNEYRQHG